MPNWTPEKLREHTMKTAQQHNSSNVGQIETLTEKTSEQRQARSREMASASSGAVASIPSFLVSPCTDESKLNKTERAYLSHLRVRLGCEPGIQDITLKLGDDCRYTPDFNFIDENGRFIFAETKGFMRDDALVKLKVAARKFRWATFILVKKDRLQFIETEIKP